MLVATRAAGGVTITAVAAGSFSLVSLAPSPSCFTATGAAVTAHSTPLLAQQLQLPMLLATPAVRATIGVVVGVAGHGDEATHCYGSLL
jgi:hypothetical protein